MVIEPIIWRRAVREYSAEPVLDESIVDIIKAVQFAPTAMNKRAVEFIVIKKQGLKNDLFEVLKQDFIKKAPVLLLLVADVKTAGLPEPDLAIASGFAMIEAASLGLGTAWKHIDASQKEDIRKILAIPKNYTFINIIPIGYPKDDLPDHSDSEFDPKKIHLDKFSQ